MFWSTSLLIDEIYLMKTSRVESQKFDGITLIYSKNLSSISEMLIAECVVHIERWVNVLNVNKPDVFSTKID